MKFTSTTNHVFTFERVTLCTIVLIHKDTGQQYVVIFTDNNNIRDYKTGIVSQNLNFCSFAASSWAVVYIDIKKSRKKSRTGGL
ncbi:TPA: hypothetical protein ACUBDH_002910 [Escherichia coli]